MCKHSFLAAIISLVSICSPILAENHPDSCVPSDWFALQKKVEAGGASLLCRGAVDASLEKRAQAEHELKLATRQAPQSTDSSDASEVLVNMYFREGQYRKALAQLDKELKEKPGAEDAKAVRSLFAVLAQSPDLKVASSKPSIVPSEVIDGNVFVYLTANGVPGSYILDTGANNSALCESEARRLGLPVHETTSKVTDISGSPSAVRVAVVPDLWIGKTHLKNVAFLVFPDANEPFVDLPAGHKGLLGIPVLIALGVFRIDRENHIEILPAAATASKIVSLPMAFDGSNPVTQMSLGGKAMSFTLDMGATHTILYPPFAAAFHELMRLGSKQEHKLTGLSGSTEQESISIPSVRFSFGKDVELAPATVLMKSAVDTSHWAYGNLGFDILTQVLPLTIDFRAMQLRVEDH
jgi:predicted aspartyl protease